LKFEVLNRWAPQAPQSHLVFAYLSNLMSVSGFSVSTASCRIRIPWLI